MATQGERLAALERGLSDHESRCEERLGEIKALVAKTDASVEKMNGRSWAIVAALLAWALAQLWAANEERADRLERARPPVVAAK